MASALLVVLAPVGAVAVGTMALDMLRCRPDRGRLLYRERRISRGRAFDVLKLRAVREDVLAAADGHARPLEVSPANLT